MIVAIITGVVVGLIGFLLAYLVYFVTYRVCERITLDNSRFHRIRVVTPDSMYPTHVYLDGKKLKGVRSVDYHISVDEVPTVTIEFYGQSIEMDGYVHNKRRSDNKFR